MSKSSGTLQICGECKRVWPYHSSTCPFDIAARYLARTNSSIILRAPYVDAPPDFEAVCLADVMNVLAWKQGSAQTPPGRHPASFAVEWNQSIPPTIRAITIQFTDSTVQRIE